MSPDCICSILTQTMVALLIIEEQIGSPQAATYTCSNSLRAGSFFNTCITIPTWQAGGHGQPGQSAIVTSNIMAYSSAGGSVIPSPTSASASDNPCMENLGAPFSGVYSPCSSGEYISPESLCLLGVHDRCTTAINSIL